MAKYVFSYRVPSDYAPHAGTPAEWQAWFGGMGSALVDFGHAADHPYASSSPARARSRAWLVTLASSHQLFL